MYFFSPRLQGYLVARRSAWKECGCPTPLCISNTMQRHNVTCRTHITLPRCPMTTALNRFVFASLLPSRFLCQGARDSSDSTILRMYHCNNCNVSTMCPKKLGSWPLNFGLQQHSVRNFFLGHPICSKHVWNIQIFSSNTTLHWADSLYSLEKKLALLSQVATTAARRHAWPATQDPNSRSSLESAFMFGIESMKDKR